MNSQGYLGRPVVAVLVTLPLTVPVLYALYVNTWISSYTTSTTGRRDKHRAVQKSDATSGPRDPTSLPGDVKSDDGSKWAIFYERVVSKPMPKSSLNQAFEPGYTLQTTPLLRDYLRATHGAFSWTPQAILIRAMIKEPELKRTFDSDWIYSLKFALGDYVNGIYRVCHHEKDPSSERLELMIEVPASYKGPAARGLLVAAMEPTGKHADGESDNVVLVNETWMWRRVDEPHTLLETSFGKWFHGKLAGWLIMKGYNHIVQTK